MNEWTDGAAGIDTGFDPDTGGVITVSPKARRDGHLHELRLHLLFNHSSGVFAGTDGVWRGQHAKDRGVDLSSAYFWQWNATAGWRSPRRRIEASVGLLNILGDWEGLHPINLHVSPLRQRTLAASLRLAF